MMTASSEITTVTTVIVSSSEQQQNNGDYKNYCVITIVDVKNRPHQSQMRTGLTPPNISITRFDLPAPFLAIHIRARPFERSVPVAGSRTYTIHHPRSDRSSELPTSWLIQDLLTTLFHRILN